MRQEHLDALRTGRRQLAEERAVRELEAIRVGKWRVFRLDEWNFAMAEDGCNDYRYYPHFEHAVLALLTEEIDANVRSDWQTCFDAIQQAKYSVIAALQKAK